MNENNLSSFASNVASDLQHSGEVKQIDPLILDLIMQIVTLIIGFLKKDGVLSGVQIKQKLNGMWFFQRWALRNKVYNALRVDPTDKYNSFFNGSFDKLGSAPVSQVDELL